MSFAILEELIEESNKAMEKVGLRQNIEKSEQKESHKNGKFKILNLFYCKS